MNVALPLARDLTSKREVALILDSHGRELADGKFLPEEPDPPPPVPSCWKEALSGDNEVTYITKHGGDSVLVVLVPLRSVPGGKRVIGVAQLSSSLRDINMILSRHAFYLGGGVVLTLLMGMGLSVLLATSALDGLNRVIDTCREISMGNFDKRVHLPRRGDEVGRLAKVFDEMVDKINGVFLAQKRFVANAAHELRTPLTVLKGSAEILLRSAKDERRDVLVLSRGILKEVNRLTYVCDRLLDIAKLEGSFQLKKSKVNLGDLIRECVLSVPEGGRRIRIEKGPFVELFADKEMLMQVLFNLLINAVQHTSEDDEICVRWRLSVGEVVVGVEDNGVGIEAEDVPRVFEPFHRGKNSSGAGLGLTLVKSVVEAHGGRIWVSSKVGHGTLFEFSLPFR